MSAFLDALKQRVLLCDGAVGTRVQALTLDLHKDFLGQENCTEILNRSRPDLVAPENVDGCDHSYGTSVCVPWIFPTAVTTARQRCAWLRKHGFGRITVAGRDRHGLDPDHDEIACDDRATA